MNIPIFGLIVLFVALTSFGLGVVVGVAVRALA
jgi:hypothetical protein